jgi:hypothetical protein
LIAQPLDSHKESDTLIIELSARELGTLTKSVPPIIDRTKDLHLWANLVE